MKENLNSLLVLKNLHMNRLLEYAEELSVKKPRNLSKKDLILEIIKAKAEAGHPPMHIEGLIEVMNKGSYGFIRADTSGRHDIYVPSNIIRNNFLRTGSSIEGDISSRLKPGESYLSLSTLTSVDGFPPNKRKDFLKFEELTPCYGKKMISLEIEGSTKDENLSGRIIDLICPILQGSRAYILAPAGAGKTNLVKCVVRALEDKVFEPNINVIVLLIGERPEEKTEMLDLVKKGKVIATTFDETPQKQINIANLGFEHSKRLAEVGEHSVVIVDSFNRLLKAFDATKSNSRGKALSGGTSEESMQRIKNTFGIARDTKEAGSITIIGTGLGGLSGETHNKKDGVFQEEIKATGNTDIFLERNLADKGYYPAINILKSKTRRIEELLPVEKRSKIMILKRFLSNMKEEEALLFLIERLKKTKNNDQFLNTINPPV